MLHHLTVFALLIALFALPGPAFADVKDQVAVLMNEVRKRQGKDPLTESNVLKKVAQDHAEDMVRHGYFSHTAKDGSNQKNRIERSGFEACATAENIAHGYDTAEEVMAVWMESDGHRTNILRGKLTHYGIGLHNGFWVVVFATPC